jgi:small subunit ribosomal protein S17
MSVKDTVKHAVEKAEHAVEKAVEKVKSAVGAGGDVAAEPSRGFKRRLVGRVVNDTASAGRAQKTVVVEVVTRFRDPVYGKYVKNKKKFHAHDEKHEFKTRDLVEIEECRPLSRTKRWIVRRLVERPPEV